MGTAPSRKDSKRLHLENQRQIRTKLQLMVRVSPYNPNFADFVKVTDYIVSYFTKGNIGYMTEHKLMKELITK